MDICFYSPSDCTCNDPDLFSNSFIHVIFQYYNYIFTHPPIIQPIAGIVQCLRIAEDEDGSIIFKLSLPFVIFLFLFSCVILPVLLKDLRGHSKLYMILHQLSNVLHLTLILVPHIVSGHLKHATISERSLHILTERRWNIIVACSIIFKQFFYYQHHAFTFLQCGHYRSMICDPLRFKEFSACKKVLRRIAIALLLFSLLLIDDITKISFEFRVSLVAEQKERVVSKITMYSFVELSVFKLLYIGTLVKISLDIRNSLSQAENVRDEEGTRRPLFYVVAVIPLINSILCSSIEITTAAIIFYLRSNLKAYECTSADQKFSRVVQIPLVASVYLLTSIINTCGYLICFPKLRYWQCCRNT